MVIKVCCVCVCFLVVEEYTSTMKLMLGSMLILYSGATGSMLMLCIGTRRSMLMLDIDVSGEGGCISVQWSDVRMVMLMCCE